jgi:glutamate racemase
VALPALRERFPELPVFGVVEPGAQLACATSRSGRIVVLATEGTVRGGAYERAILARRPDARVTSVGCQVFVALAEEGWHRNEVARAAAAEYLRPLFVTPGTAPDCLVLGCTHFPLLRDAIAEVCGPGVTIIDSAASAAVTVALAVSPTEPRTERAAGSTARHDAPASARLHCLATDGLERFRRIGPRFLGEALAAGQVELVDI